MGVPTPPSASASHPSTTRCPRRTAPALRAPAQLAALAEQFLAGRATRRQLQDWAEAAPLDRWRLWRSDDNGNLAVVRDFTGYAKARTVLARYEAGAHKQSYWLEAIGSR